MSKINTGLEIRFPKNLVKVKREKYHKGRKKTKKKKKKNSKLPRRDLNLHPNFRHRKISGLIPLGHATTAQL